MTTRGGMNAHSSPWDPFSIYEETDNLRASAFGQLLQLFQLKKFCKQLRPGTQVCIRGMTARPDLNGKHATVLMYCEASQRYAVSVLSDDATYHTCESASSQQNAQLAADDHAFQSEEKGCNISSSEGVAVKVKRENLALLHEREDGSLTESEEPNWMRLTFTMTVNAFLSKGRAYPKDFRLRAPAEYKLSSDNGSRLCKSWFDQPFPKQGRVFLLPEEHYMQCHKIREDPQQKYTYHPQKTENRAAQGDYDDYEWLVDCYRLRLSDEVYWCVGSVYASSDPKYTTQGRKFYPNRRGLYAQAGSPQELKQLILFDVALFLRLCSERNMLPSGFEVAYFLESARQANKLTLPFSKSMAIDKYGEENVYSNCRSLRRTAEQIYGTSLPELGKTGCHDKLVRALQEKLHLAQPPPAWLGKGKGKSGFLPLLERFFASNANLSRGVKRLWQSQFLDNADYHIPEELLRYNSQAETANTCPFVFKFFDSEEDRMPPQDAFRLISLQQHIMKTTLRVPMVSFIDDVCAIERQGTVAHTFNCLKRLHEACFTHGGEEFGWFERVLAKKYGNRVLCCYCNAEESVGQKFQRCAGCQVSSAHYCSRECQKLDWPRHKFECIKAK